MQAPSQDTIAAVATPAGRGGIGVIRISGSQTQSIAQALLGYVPPCREATLSYFRDAEGEPIDQGIALFFPAPHSFTGEDVLELQGHGGPVIMDCLLRRVASLGARVARPGEFSERAFLNDKLDLAQAEAIADLIDSTSERAARSALRSLNGDFSQRIHALVDALIDLRMFVEAALDFADEEIDFLADTQILTRLEALRQQIHSVRTSAQQGSLLREGITVVIAGHPNAGKSSLLNRLAGRESAIVTAVPGTTRDVLREQIHIEGVPVHVLDTAGLREPKDIVEREGVRRAHVELVQADRILLVIDDSCAPTPTESELLHQLPMSSLVRERITIVRNKIDLTGEFPRVEEKGPSLRIFLSAATGAGLELLCEHLKDVMGFVNIGEGVFTARRRHLEALDRAAAALQNANEQLRSYQAGELFAEELRQAQDALSEITGEFTNEDLLDRIFSSFCIGK